jgi:hypothetical protein
MPTNLSASELQRGDIVFFAPVARDDMTVFSQLAAYVQTWPYQPADKPWYHVAIASDASKVIDFEPVGGTDGDPMVWNDELGSRDLQDDPEVSLRVFRLSDGADRDALMAALNPMVGNATYTKAGLLAFAAVTEARMFKGETSREKLYDFAAGFEVLARGVPGPVGYTCVTGVTSAIGSARIELAAELNDQVEEPPPPANPFPDWDLTHKSVLNLYAHLQAVSTRATKFAQKTPEAEVLLGDAAVQTGYDGDNALLRLAPGDLIKTTKDYVNALGQVMVTIKQAQPDWTIQKLLDAGFQTRENSAWPSPESWVVSPGMLYDGLLGCDSVELVSS